MSRLRGKLEWTAAVLLGCFGMLGLAFLGSVTAGRLGVIVTSAVLLLAAALLAPVFWRRAAGGRQRTIRYVVAAVLVAGAMLAPIKVTSVVHLPGASAGGR